MVTEWEVLYRQALQELDPEKLPAACDRARRAINERLTQLVIKGIAADKERDQLFEALRTLLIHEHKRKAPN